MKHFYIWKIDNYIIPRNFFLSCFAPASCNSNNETNIFQALCTFSRDSGCFAGRCKTAKGLILPHACIHVSPCLCHNREYAFTKPRKGIYIRACVYFAHHGTHPSHAYPRLNPFNVLFVFLIVSVCSCVNRRLNENGKTIDEDGWKRASRKG